MPQIRPFRAVRPTPPLAATIASVPYDVCDTQEARALAEGNPLSFLHVIRPEIDLPDGTDPYDDAVYAGGRAALDRLIADGHLVADTSPGIFLYRQVWGDHVQVGVVCCSSVADYTAGLIKRHEHTRPAKEDDRTRHVLTLKANAGPVFLAFRDDAAIDRLVREDLNQRPIVHFDAPDGVTHTVWAVAQPAAYVDAFAALPASYVADGHHRAASAARAGAELRGDDPADPDDASEWFLTVLFPAGALKILPYNRVVRDLNGLTPAAFLEQLAGIGAVEATSDPEPGGPLSFGVYVDGGWHRLTLDPASIDAADPIASLDCQLLQDRVLTPVLGIGDPRTDERIAFIGGIRGTEELERRVDDGRDAVAFAMYPTSMDQLMAVADAGMVMPPKSTWFEPKLRSGLFLHRLEGRMG